MAISKIILNGVTQMDLTNDTTDASKTLASYTGHGADGEAFTGSYVPQIGVDIPIFTYDGQTATCNKTFAECFAIVDYGKTAAMIIDGYGWEASLCANVYSSSQITYTLCDNLGKPYEDFFYNSNGTISSTTPSHASSVLTTKTITANGTYDAEDDNADGYSSVNVNVPTPTLQTKSVSITPSETAQSQTVTPDSGYGGLDEVDVNVGAISSTYVGSEIARRSSSDLTASGATVTAPAGYYESSASKSVASGTAGTPSASKGTVSNHSISVTPSVTNTTGYITGGTKTGTAVSVSASELVSGTYTVDSSGTKDVTNYASASVPSGTAGTPSATKGTVSNHSVSVTPSVTNSTGWITGSTKTGTAVTVSASELVSGTYNITASGTHDVTNYASASVTFSTIYTGSSAPSSSQGSNGDIYIRT